MFFEHGKAAKELWFYEILPPTGCKKYSKTNPMQYDELAGCITWWNQRTDNENTWRVPVADILQYDGDNLISTNLDRKNPSRRNEN